MNPLGTPVLSAAAGTAIVAGSDLFTVYGAKPDFYGNMVIQELDLRLQGKAVYVLYGHLSEVAVDAGDHLEAGEVLGRVGMTGVAIGHHLHLEVRLGATDYGSTRNPVLWLQPEPGQGAIAGLLLDGDGQPVPETPVTFFRAAEPDKWWRQTQTYADREVNPDDALGENFALAYVPAGDYLAKAKVGERTYVRPVTVGTGDVAFVQIEPEE
jgi:murein DD-endopeptidase MepM/ murein hydrolase activator NlpD